LYNSAYFGFYGSSTLDAQAELISEGSIRLTLKRPSRFHWSAGQTAYIILPGVSVLPFEAHPFTIASIDARTEGSVPDEKSHVACPEKGGEAYWKEIIFLMSVRGGFTKRLAAVAATKSAVKCLIDGPYGPTPDIGRSDSCMLICGELTPDAHESSTASCTVVEVALAFPTLFLSSWTLSSRLCVMIDLRDTDENSKATQGREIAVPQIGIGMGDARHS
jgi:hypothetical protein